MSNGAPISMGGQCPEHYQPLGTCCQPTVRYVSVPDSSAPFGYSYSVTSSAQAICPDLLSIRDIGEADGWRGRLVRGFFRLLKVATGV